MGFTSRTIDVVSLTSHSSFNLYHPYTHAVFREYNIYHLKSLQICIYLNYVNNSHLFK